MSKNRQYTYERNLTANDYEYGPSKGELELMREEIEKVRSSQAALLYTLVEKQWITAEQADDLSKGFSGSPHEWEDRRKESPND